MNIDLEKSEYKYYYSIDGNQYGPYNLIDLIPLITSTTLVWREGIEWTNANRLDELKSYFPEEVKIHSAPIYSEPVTTSKPVKGMFSSPFSFDGRIRRLEYGISFIIYCIVYSIVLAMIESSKGFGIIIIPLLWFLWAQGAKRCHDRGNSGWYQIIPFYVLWLIFAEGDDFTNDYGDSPK
jgi:uncharacterized membrane protein YhaH (DUF805 family)